MTDTKDPFSLRAAAVSQRAEILGEAVRIVHRARDEQEDPDTSLHEMNAAIGFDQACERIINALRTAQLSEPATEDEVRAAESLVQERLYRTHYLVIPRLAIQAMPDSWKARLEALLAEADATGLETPTYTVLRSDPAFTRAERYDEDDPGSTEVTWHRLQDDPWSDYRRGDVKALCPGFKEPA